jgi:hypothetical protein
VTVQKQIWIRLKDGSIVMTEPMDEGQAKVAFERVLRELELGESIEPKFLRLGETVAVQITEIATVQLRDAPLPSAH